VSDEAPTPEQDAADEELRAVMVTPPGRRVVFRLLDSSTNLFGQSFTGDALTSAFGEGRRAVGISLMQELQRACPREYLQMLGEAFTAQLQESARKRPSDVGE